MSTIASEEHQPKNYAELSLIEHQKHQWKLTMQSTVPLETKDDLSTYYSPGVAAPCLEIAANPSKSYDYTRKWRTIAVVSDGSAVLGLGNIGWLAWLPVMEGKAILFKKFGNVDAVPIVLNTQDPDEIIRTVEAIAPTFGWINLEDIKAPECFYVEEELKKRLSIPVFHDDQHGTAIVTLAAMINALKLVWKEKDQIKIVMSWAWAAATAIANLLIARGVKHIVLVDTKWAIYTGRTEWMTSFKEKLAQYNIHNQQGGIHDIIVWADVFLGLSQPNLIDRYDVEKMASQPIIFAMSNPNPEIHPDEAKAWGAYIVATGRSDFPNQVNNVLVFPGIFKGALQNKVKQFTTDHFLSAAQALADAVSQPTPDNIIPSPFTEGVADIIAEVIL
jgi:malate dehydrogenase (oxaloacetate-decarboxylating)